MNLSEELKQQIEQEAEGLYDALNEAAINVDTYNYGLPMFDKQKQPIVEVLTTYATKLHHSNEVNKALEETNRGLVEHNKEAKDLLHEVFQKHESGLLPDRFVYEKIKSFLYPEKK